MLIHKWLEVRIWKGNSFKWDYLINKESTSEAFIVLTSGIMSDSLMNEEIIQVGIKSVVGEIELCINILIMNHIVMQWCENVSIWVKKDMFVDVISECCGGLLEPSKEKMIVIGAGLVGLAAARQLMLFGFEMIVLEGRKCAGWQVYMKKMEGGNKATIGDVGGSVLTGTLLHILDRQWSYAHHKVRDQCSSYHDDRKPIN